MKVQVLKEIIEKYPDINNITEYVSDLGQCKLICNTDKGFRCFDSDGTYFRDCSSWDEAVKTCEFLCEWSYDNWLTQGSDPSARKQAV